MSDNESKHPPGERVPSFWGAFQTRAWEENREDLQRIWDAAQNLAPKSEENERSREWIPGKPKWQSAQTALRFGVGAASFWAGEPWTPQLEQRLRDAWQTLAPATPWDEARAVKSRENPSAKHSRGVELRRRCRHRALCDDDAQKLKTSGVIVAHHQSLRLAYGCYSFGQSA